MFDLRAAVTSRLLRQLMTTSLRVLLVLVMGLVTCVAVAVAQNTPQRESLRPVAQLIESGPIPTANYTLHRAPSNLKSTVSPVGPVVSSSVAALERRAFDLINAQRKLNGQKPLPWDPELARLARQHSESMASDNYFNHSTPGGMTVANRARAQGIRGWSALGENIAYNQGYDDPAGFVAERWMTSYKHRENLLNSRWVRSAVGVAIARDGRVFFTQVFIAP